MQVSVLEPRQISVFINAQGRLQRYPGSVLPPQYPVERIIQRYEEMISRYAARLNQLPCPETKHR